MKKIPYQKRSGFMYRSKNKYVDLFCTNCWRHEDLFTGGGSWSPDICPCRCEDTIPWYKMSIFQRRKALKVWEEKGI